jgi:hypothetical protein
MMFAAGYIHRGERLPIVRLVLYDLLIHSRGNTALDLSSKALFQAILEDYQQAIPGKQVAGCLLTPNNK